MAQTVGEISNLRFYFEWSIADFFSRLEKSDVFYSSPTFLYSGDAWTLTVYPNGNKSPGYVSLYLKWLNTNGNKFANFKLAIKRKDGSEYARLAEHLFSLEEVDWGWSKFLKKSEISSDRSLMAPGNVLTISCTLTYEKSAAVESFASESEKLCRGEPSTKPKILWGTLSSNLKDLFLSQENADFIIKVKDEMFPVHRMILSARSTVFAAMLEHDMQEKLEGTVELYDANPSTFRDLLMYMYSGEVKTLSSENVYDLYVLSDKYNLKDFKEECKSFMECSLSTDTVCDVLLLAEKYNEVQLKECAEKYFTKNVDKVMESDHWKTFESDNHVLVIQLLKSIVLEKVSKSAS